ncbi:hypothetical protein K0M31_017178 [Melipona bicolor]|uniref:Uncharacterized protein n=1 Tax=Melipona bicolor TaxID=60889 RepID=A0AA40KS73_9HYME|nr:hypothetical protein K0M31_017178 [Melipona bicolor]
MKQVDGHKSKCVARSYLDARDHPDSCRKRTQKKSQSFLVNKSSKPCCNKHFYEKVSTDCSLIEIFLRNPELSSSYYSTPTCCYKPQRNASIHDSDDAPYLQRDVSRSKPNRDKHRSGYTSRKTHYDDEVRNVDSFEFTDDKLGGLAGGHVVEDVEEEVAEDDREVLAEFLNNDYEEREEFDETDEIENDESDRSPQTQRSRSQRGSKPEATASLTKQQRWRGAEQQPDTRKFRCQQRVATHLRNHPPPSRYYHSVAEPEETEPLSEEDFVRTSLRRQPADYRQWWSSSRNEPDRYDDVATSMQSTRRARTKPAVDRTMEPELNGTRRCDRCGSLSSSKNGPPLKNTCRFDDCASIPIKGPIGDEPDNYEQTFCGRCNSRDPSGIVDAPSSAYATKSRRPRETRSPTFYELPDQSQEKFSSDYSRSPSRYQSGRPVYADRFAERSKRSLHASRGNARTLPRYVE